MIRLPGTVSNALNARQSEILTKFPQKASFKPNDEYSMFVKKCQAILKIILVL